MARIFIAEDDDALRKLYIIALTHLGHEIMGQATNGYDAVHMFKSFNEKPDVIIIDHRMPLKNGLEAMKEILEMDGSSRIILASADHSIKEDALRAGAMSFKEKPFNLEKLRTNIIKVLTSPKKKKMEDKNLIHD